MFVSVIVCTRNRCEKLHLALDCLAVLDVPKGVRVEFIIVDNGSTDATAEAFRTCAVAHPGTDFKYVFEGTRGKSSALNSGMRAARGDVFAFTDDDCMPDPTWIAQVAAAFQADSELMVLGGRVELYNPQDLAVTVITHSEPIDVSRSPDRLFDPILIGANTAFRRRVYEAVGDYDLRLGPGSPKGAIAEDMDYIYMAWRRGMKIMFLPQVRVFHNHGRQTEAEERAVSHGYGVGRGAFYAKHLFSDRHIARYFVRDLRWILANSVRSVVKGQLPRRQLRTLRSLTLGVLARLGS